MPTRLFFVTAFLALSTQSRAAAPAPENYDACVKGDVDFDIGEEFPPVKDQHGEGICGDEGETALFAWSVGVETGSVPDVSPQWAACRRLEDVGDAEAAYRMQLMKKANERGRANFLRGSRDGSTLTALQQSDNLALDAPELRSSFEAWFKHLDEDARKKKLTGTRRRCEYVDGLIQSCTSTTEHLALPAELRKSLRVIPFDIGSTPAQRKPAVDLLNEYGEPRNLAWLDSALRTKYLTPVGLKLWDAVRTPEDVDHLDELFNDSKVRGEYLRIYAHDKPNADEVDEMDLVMTRSLFTVTDDGKKNSSEHLGEVLKRYRKRAGDHGLRDLLAEEKTADLPRINALCAQISRAATERLLGAACRGVAVSVSTKISGLEYGPLTPATPWQPRYVRAYRVGDMHKMIITGVQRDPRTGTKYFSLRNSWGTDGTVTRLPFDRACLISSAYTFLGPKGLARLQTKNPPSAQAPGGSSAH